MVPWQYRRWETSKVVPMGTAWSDINQKPVQRQRPAPLHHVLTSPAAVEVTASEMFGLQLSPNYKAHI